MLADLIFTIDLRMLVYTAALSLVLWIPYMLVAMGKRGIGAVAGYPTGRYDDLPEAAQRAQRAHANLVENLAPFAVLVLVAHVSGSANETTALGAQLFFWARVVQAAVHIFGVPWLRTAAFLAGWVGNLLIFWQILY